MINAGSNLNIRNSFLSVGGFMVELKKIFITFVWFSFLLFVGVQQLHAQASGHASVGLGHGEEGYLHLEEMIKHLEFGLKMPDAGQDLRTHGSEAIKHAKEALDHYDKALKHANESLGRPTRNPMAGGGSGSEHSREEGSSHSHEEGSH